MSSHISSPLAEQLVVAADLRDAVLLIVDSEAARSRLLHEVLTAVGVQVLLAESGPQAKQQLLQMPVDLVLLVLRPAGALGGMDSYELCRQLKLPPQTRNIPVVFLEPAACDVTDAAPRPAVPLGRSESGRSVRLEESDESHQLGGHLRAFRTGAADFVSSAIAFPELLVRVEHHIRVGRRLRELEREKAELARELRELKRERPAPAAPQIISPMDLPRGFILDGKYRLEERIGVGGFGVVYRTTHLQLQREVAVKVFRPLPTLSTEEAIARFRQEGTSASRLSHPNAITILDSGIAAGGIPYLAMELLIGRTLADELRERSPLPLSRCIQIIVPVCDVLIEAHAAGIVHRDVKPDNVFLHRTRSGEVIKVLDFGIAKLLEGTADRDAPMVTGGGAFVGTPTYMAPERLRQGSYDGRSDVYSVGVMLYQMLSGRPPFESPSQSYLEIVLGHLNQPPPPLRERRPSIPESVAQVVMHTLEKDPQSRPTARQLLTELVRVVRKSVGQLEAASDAPARSPAPVAVSAARSPSSSSTGATVGVLPRHLPGIWPGSSASMATPFRAESSISESSQSYAPSAVRVGKATGETALIQADRAARGGKTSPSGELPLVQPVEESSELSLPTAVTIEFEMSPSQGGSRR